MSAASFLVLASDCAFRQSQCFQDTLNCYFSSINIHVVVLGLVESALMISSELLSYMNRHINYVYFQFVSGKIF